MNQTIIFTIGAILVVMGALVEPKNRTDKLGKYTLYLFGSLFILQAVYTLRIGV